MGRHIVTRMTTSNGGPLSLGPISSIRLKNLRDVDKWSSLSLCLSVRGECQSLESLGCTCVAKISQIDSVSAVVQGDNGLGMQLVCTSVLHPFKNLI